MCKNIKLAYYFAHYYHGYAQDTLLTREDLVQEGLIGFVCALRRYRGGALGPEKFAVARMRYAVHDALDAQHRKKVYQDCLPLDDYRDTLSYDCQAAETHTAKQLIDSCSELAHSLNEVMRLIYVEDLTKRETASRLGVHETRVNQLHKKAINQLRDKHNIRGG